MYLTPFNRVSEIGNTATIADNCIFGYMDGWRLGEILMIEEDVLRFIISYDIEITFFAYFRTLQPIMSDKPTNEAVHNLNDDFPDLIEWKSEAQAIINDVRSHVKDIAVSDKLPSSRTHIFLNVTTLEGRRMCVQISSAGFQIVGSEYDDNTAAIEMDQHPIREEIYETPYALLSEVSDGYVQSFGGELANALQKLIWLFIELELKLYKYTYI